MTDFEQDMSGIYSLSGFAYQILVFTYYALTLETGMSVAFEALDDVNITTPSVFDNEEEKFQSRFSNNNTNTVIQVKRTRIATSEAKKTLLNWILLEKSDYEVSKYILFTDPSYENQDILFDTTAQDLYNDVIGSNRTERAVITKVKNIFKKDFNQFERIYNAIKSKYKFISDQEICKLIEDKCVTNFRRGAVKDVIYYARIKELLSCITSEIMYTINNRESYKLTFSDLLKCIEDISIRFTDKIIIPRYSCFKKINPVDLSKTEVAKSREYKQLQACQLYTTIIASHLQHSFYYNHSRCLYMENGKSGKIDDIEVTTFENFLDAKGHLQNNNQDTPNARLYKTKEYPNSYADNEQIRSGVCIYLTGDNIKDKQISWEDADNV